jgi:hypothetical protein
LEEPERPRHMQDRLRVLGLTGCDTGCRCGLSRTSDLLYLAVPGPFTGHRCGQPNYQNEKPNNAKQEEATYGACDVNSWSGSSMHMVGRSSGGVVVVISILAAGVSAILYCAFVLDPWSTTRTRRVASSNFRHLRSTVWRKKFATTIFLQVL